MAYGTKYYVNFCSKRGVSGTIRLKKDGYVGSATQLNMESGGFEVNYNFDKWFKPLLGQNASLTIINEKANWYDLDDLMDLGEKEFLMEVDASDNSGKNITLFKGWVHAETTQQEYKNKATFNLTASNYISKIKDVEPSTAYEIAARPFYSYLDDCLRVTDLDRKTYVNCTLSPTGSTLPAHNTFVNLSGTSSESFWKNNVEREGAEKVIKDILTPFSCVLYPWDDKWYIERYSDIYQNETYKYYTTYNSNQYYGYSNSGGAFYDYTEGGSTNIWDLTLVNPTVKVEPGLGKINVKTKMEVYDNLAPKNFIDYPWNVTYSLPDGDVRVWEHQDSSIEEAYLYNYRYGASDYGWANTTEGVTNYRDIQNAAVLWISGGFFWYNNDGWGTNNYLKGRGISTKFSTTVTDSSTNPVELNIKWKWNNGTRLGGMTSKSYKNDYCKYYRLYWYLRKDGDDGNRYIKYDEDLAQWYLSGYLSALDGANYIQITPDQVDQNTGTYEASVTIPLSDVSDGGTGNFDYIFSVNHSQYRFESSVTQELDWDSWNVIGDIQISLSVGEDDNEFIGDLDNDFTDEKQITFEVFDASNNKNFRNKILTGSDFKTGTDVWTDSNGVNFMPLHYWAIADKSQLYNKNRRKISSKVIHNEFLKPFSVWWDGKDPDLRTYVLVGYKYKPDIDEYNINWWEYNQETVNIT